MHELGVAMAIQRACRTEIDARGGGTLRSVRIAVGELAGVDPTLLRHAWPTVVSGTSEDGSTIEVTWHEAVQSCPACGPIAERQPGTWLRLCPHCAGPLSVEDASQLDITQIDFSPSAACAPL